MTSQICFNAPTIFSILLQIVYSTIYDLFYFSIQMGASAVIEYSNGITYEGQVKEKQNQKQSGTYKIPHGKGTVTFKSNSKIQGQFCEGQLKHGYLQCQEFTYTGNFKEQSLNGEGILVDNTNTIYEGLFQYGRLKKGIITKKNDKKQNIYRFQGEVHDLQKMSAKGKLKIQFKDDKQNPIADRRLLEGEFMEGNLQGKGRYEFQNGDFYDGFFESGRPNGQVCFKSKNIQISGKFSKNTLQGQVKIVFSNKDVYQGEIKDGKMHGRGKYTYANGTIYDGQFYYGQQWGQCKITYPKNSQIQSYEGQVSKGIYQGIGVLYYSNGVIFKGFFENGMKNCFGVLIYGKNKYKCLYLLNDLAGEMKKIDED